LLTEAEQVPFCPGQGLGCAQQGSQSGSLKHMARHKQHCAMQASTRLWHRLQPPAGGVWLTGHDASRLCPVNHLPQWWSQPCMYVCRRLNLGRIRKDIDNPEQPGNPPSTPQLVCRTKNLQDQSRRPVIRRIKLWLSIKAVAGHCDPHSASTAGGYLYIQLPPLAMLRDVNFLVHPQALAKHSPKTTLASPSAGGRQ
jgi:hypothetical protein